MKPLLKSLVVSTWACILVTGCSRPHDPSIRDLDISNSAIPDLGGNLVPIAWSAPAGKENPLPGIDQGCVYSPGKAFLLWSDRAGGIAVGSSLTAPGFECHGSLLGQDGRHMELLCETKDGKAGQAKIDGVTYDLAEGNLFMISTQGEQIQVKQLKRDLSALKFEVANLQTLGRDDPGIVGFFTRGYQAEIGTERGGAACLAAGGLMPNHRRLVLWAAAGWATL